MGYKDKNQQRAYQLEWLRKRRETLLAKLGDSCQNCGSHDDLQFDHIDPLLKRFEINDRLSARWSEIVEEVKKCQLLCRSCHNAKSRVDIGGKNCKTAKLTEEAVHEIRNTVGNTKRLAEKFGVSKRAVRYVRSEQVWKYMESNPRW